MSRYLGQHFLINENKLKKIAETLELKDNDIVIEIGPGHGELTREIAERGKEKEMRIIAIEKDKYLAKQLSENFQFSIFNFSAQGGSASGGQSNSNFQISKINTGIIIGDALKVLPKLTRDLRPTTNNYKVVGNIPYYITGYLLRILGELENKPSLIVLTIQKEVAQRLCAGAIRMGAFGLPKPQAEVRYSGAMNLLAASVQFWAKPEIIDYVSKKDFRPMPKVDSAIIKLTTNNLRPTTDEKNRYYKFIKILFKQPRKTIANNVLFACRDAKNANTRECREKIVKTLHKIKIESNARPQDLNMEQIIKLSEFFS